MRCGAMLSPKDATDDTIPRHESGDNTVKNDTRKDGRPELSQWTCTASLRSIFGFSSQPPVALPAAINGAWYVRWPRAFLSFNSPPPPD